MPKLGFLLLKSFSRKIKRKKIQTKICKRNRKNLSLFQSAAQLTHSAAPSRRISNSVAVVSAPLSIQSQPQSKSLLNAELINPQDQLKKSIEAFLLDQRSEHTRRAYGKDLKRFVKFLVGRKYANGNSRIESLDRGLLITYKDYLLSEKLEHTTIDRHLACLRSFFRWLVEDGLIEKNPAENVRFLNPKRTSPTIGFTDEEVRRVLKLPDLHTRTGSLHYAVLMILFYCGLRRSELCDLRLGNLGIERGHYFLRLRGKGNAERVVVMIEPVWNAIQHYLKMTRKGSVLQTKSSPKTGDQPLFTPIRNNRTGVRNKPLDSSMIFYIVKRYARDAGIENKVSPHSCRATAISNARDHNVPDRAIQEFAGWSTTTMITRYDKRKTALEKSASHAIDYGDEDRKLPFVKD